MHDIMSEHRVLQTKCWFAKGKKKTLSIHEMKISFQNSHFKCICGFPSSGTEYYIFLMCLGDSTEEVIPTFCVLLVDIFIHSRYLMKHLFLFIVADMQYL